MRRLQLGGRQGRGDPAVTMADRPRIKRERVKVDGRTVQDTVTVYETRAPWWRRPAFLLLLAQLVPLLFAMGGVVWLLMTVHRLFA